MKLNRFIRKERRRKNSFVKSGLVFEKMVAKNIVPGGWIDVKAGLRIAYGNQKKRKEEFIAKKKERKIEKKKNQ